MIPSQDKTHWHSHYWKKSVSDQFCKRCRAKFPIILPRSQKLDEMQEAEKELDEVGLNDDDITS